MKLAIFLVLLLAFSALGQTATVIGEKAKLRGTPSDKGKIIASAERGESVDVLKTQGDWFLVQTKDYVGWLPTGTLQSVNISAPFPGPLPKNPNITPILSTPPATKETPSRTYIRGSRGGCYYLNSKGNKTYVDRSLCG